MKKADLVGFYGRIASDPDIKNPAHFQSYMSSFLEQSKPFARHYEQGEPDFKPASGARPGTTAKIVDREFLRNETGEGSKDFEVYRFDSIPFSVYRQMDAEPEIQLVKLMLKGWIAGLEYTVEATDPVVGQVVDHVLDKVYSDLVRALLNSIIFGYVFGEKVWARETVKLTEMDETTGDEKVVFNGEIHCLDKVKFIDPEADIRYYKNKRDDLAYIAQRQFGKEVKVKRTKLVWFALDPENSDIFGRSRYKNAYDDWYHAKVNKQQLLRHVQRTGTPPLKVRYPDGVTNVGDEVFENSDVAATMARSYINSGLILLPATRDQNSGEFDWDMYFDEVKNNDTTPFLQVLDILAKRMSKGIGVPPMLVDGGGDSSSGETSAQSDMLIVVLEDLVDQIEAVIQKDLVEQIVSFNFGPEVVSSVKFRIEKSGLGRRKLFKDIYINVLRLAMASKDMLPNMFPDIAAMGSEMGVPMKALMKQVSKVEREKEGEQPAAKAQEVEDGNDKNRQRPNKTDRDPAAGSPKAGTGGK